MATTWAIATPASWLRLIDHVVKPSSVARASALPVQDDVGLTAPQVECLHFQPPDPCGGHQPHADAQRLGDGLLGGKPHGQLREPPAGKSHFRGCIHTVQKARVIAPEDALKALDLDEIDAGRQPHAVSASPASGPAMASA